MLSFVHGGRALHCVYMLSKTKPCLFACGQWDVFCCVWSMCCFVVFGPWVTMNFYFLVWFGLEQFVFCFFVIRSCIDFHYVWVANTILFRVFGPCSFVFDLCCIQLVLDTLLFCVFGPCLFFIVFDSYCVVFGHVFASVYLSHVCNSLFYLCVKTDENKNCKLSANKHEIAAREIHRYVWANARRSQEIHRYV
jgi:hypothetical protein